MKKTFFFGLLFIAAFASLIFCRREEAKNLSQVTAPAVLRVEALAPEPHIFDETVSFSANIEPREQAAVVAKAQGKTVLEVLVDEGAQVKEGQKLAVLDDSLLRQQVRQAEAALGKATSYVGTVDTDYRRIERLFKEKAVSRQQFDHIQGELRVANRQEQEARAALEQARILLSYSIIKAPIDGTLMKRNIDPGDTTGPTPAFVISRQENVKVTGSVPERDYPRIKAGQEVTVRADALPGKIFRARVERVPPSPDPVPRTGMVDVILSSEGVLKPGMFARVDILVGRHESLSLPIETVGFLPGTGNRICYVISRDEGADKVFIRQVEVGEEQSNLIEVRGGLTSSDRVVATRTSRLRDGVTVEVVER